MYNLWHHRNGTTTLNWDNGRLVWKGGMGGCGWPHVGPVLWSCFAITQKNRCATIRGMACCRYMCCRLSSASKTEDKSNHHQSSDPCYIFSSFSPKECLQWNMETLRHHKTDIKKNISCLFLQLAWSTKASEKPIINQGSISHACSDLWPFFTHHHFL